MCIFIYLSIYIGSSALSWQSGIPPYQLYLSFVFIYYLKQSVAETDQKEVFAATAPPGNSFVIRETQLPFSPPSLLFSEAGCLRRLFFSFSPPHLLCLSLQEQNRGRFLLPPNPTGGRETLAANRDEDDDVDAWEEKQKSQICCAPACTPASEHQEEVDNNGAPCMFKCKHLDKQTRSKINAPACYSPSPSSRQGKQRIVSS